MKKLYKRKLLSLTLATIITLSGAAYAAPGATYNADSPNNVVVAGKASAGEPVSIKAVSGSDISHIGMAVCDDKGNYTYKFSYTGEIDDLSLVVNQGEATASSTNITQSSDDLYTINIDILDDANNTYHIGADNTAKIRASISNTYGGTDKYSLLVSFYNAEGRLLGVEKQEGNMEYSAKGEEEIVDFECSLIPEGTETIKAFILDDLSGLKPLALSKEKSETQSFAVHKLINADGSFNQDAGELNVVYLGGSITYEGSYFDYGWSNIVTNWLRETYPNKTINHTNAGVGGTGSNSGLMRLEKDVIANNPDIVFVEYAVNDANSKQEVIESNTRYYEDIVRSLLRLDKQPVIIFLYSAIDHPGYGTTEIEYNTTNTAARNWNKSAKLVEMKIAENYGIAEIDFDAYVEGLYVAPGGSEELTENQFSDFAVYTRDNTHLTVAGNKLYADYITGLIKNNPREYFKKLNTEQERLLPATGFEHCEVIYPTDPRIVYNEEWENIGDMRAPSTGGSFTLTFNGSSIAMCGNYTYTNVAGATYSIDGGKYTGDLLEAVSKYVTGSTCNKLNFFTLTGLEDCEHTITVTANGSDTANARLQFGAIVVE